MVKKLKQHLISISGEQSNERLKLYGLLSANSYEKLWDNLTTTWDFNYASLFDGHRAEQLKTVAPYLVELSQESKHIDEILKNYGKNGGIFFCTSLEFDETLQRMREIFIVYDENGTEGYLRFYSPDIFRELIENPNPNQLQRLFKQISHYYCEAEDDPIKLNRYHYDEKSLHIMPYSLA